MFAVKCPAPVGGGESLSPLTGSSMRRTAAVIDRSEPARLPVRAVDADRPLPLVVDLDGTLVATDLLIESLFVLAKRRPLRLLIVPLWLAQGKASLKHHLACEAAP